MIRHIIFDMDGVLLDSEPVYRERIKRFMCMKGFTDIPEELYDRTCGANSVDTYRMFREKVKGFAMDYDTYMAERKAFNGARLLDPKEMVDQEIYPLFKYLKEEGFRIALASSSFKETIERNLKLLEIADVFDVVVSGMDFEHSKPDPEIYFYTMRQLQAVPENCLVVEDSGYGIAAAKAAGAIVIAKRDERFGYDQSQADYTVERLLQIVDIIKADFS